MAETNRRRFLQASAAAAGAPLVAAPAIAARRASANDRVRVGLVGLGGRMRSHVAALVQMTDENVQIAALGDCDQRRLDTAGKSYPQIADLKLAKYNDQRKLFDDPTIDAVSF
ncbi:MAG: gfo/Idh/MocA family oxidoreductase, partial [Planctomycetota bacterium]